MFKSKHPTIFDGRPDLLVYIKNQEDAKKYTLGSGKKVTCKCPNCGVEKPIMVLNLTRYGFHCTVCGDGVSYPNKFVHNLLDQLGVVHEPEKTFDWLPNKRYDQYLPGYSLIIENNGIQHYNDNNGHLFPYTTLENTQNTDKYKMDMAIQNGIKNYIYIDCSESTQQWMREHIMDSALPEILNFSEDDIDWNLCDENSNNSLILKAWDMWNNYIPTKEIALSLGVGESTVRNYIHRGIDCDKCEPYAGADREIRKARKQALNYTNGQMKPIYCITDDIYFASRFECEEYYSNLFPESGAFLLYKWINANKPYKKKIFTYITKEEFNKKLEESSMDKSIKAFGRPYRIAG